MNAYFQTIWPVLNPSHCYQAGKNRFSVLGTATFILDTNKKLVFGQLHAKMTHVYYTISESQFDWYAWYGAGQRLIFSNYVKIRWSCSKDSQIIFGEISRFGNGVTSEECFDFQKAFNLS